MPIALREALAAFRRTPLLVLLSVVAIGVSLSVVGLFGLTAFNIRQAIEAMEERVEVVAYLRDSASEEQVRRAEREIAQLPEVLQLGYVSKAAALAQAAETMAEFREVFSGLDANPLPASLEIRLRPGHRDPATVERIAQHLEAYPFVEEAAYGRDWIAKIVALRRIAGGVTAVIGGAFAVVAAIIIATAVRIAVFARREEIEIMRLVGATDGFIQRPFLIEGLLSGLIGGALAVGLTYTAFRLVDTSLIQIAWLPAAWPVIGVAVGAAFGLLASAVAVRRHLRFL
jgi:cell division transport system permease protein